MRLPKEFEEVLRNKYPDMCYVNEKYYSVYGHPQIDGRIPIDRDELTGLMVGFLRSKHTFVNGVIIDDQIKYEAVQIGFKLGDKARYRRILDIGTDYQKTLIAAVTAVCGEVTG